MCGNQIKKRKKTVFVILVRFYSVIIICTLNRLIIIVISF